MLTLLKRLLTAVKRLNSSGLKKNGVKSALWVLFVYKQLLFGTIFSSQDFSLGLWPLPLKKTPDEAVFSICGDLKVYHVRACGINYKKIRNAQVCVLADYPVGSGSRCF